jgi:uncharacterized SAM-binding protein YcdF (DUF218 family)
MKSKIYLILRILGIIFIIKIVLTITISIVILTNPAWTVKILANGLLINDKIRKADVILVVGGFEDDLRMAYSAELFNNGYGKAILITGDGTKNKVMQHMSSVLGIDKKYIIIEENANNTYENALFSLPILKEKGYKSIILVSSPDQSKRLRRIFDKVLKKENIVIFSTYSPDSVFNPDHILENKEATEQLIVEWIKSIYYFFKYFFIKL